MTMTNFGHRQLIFGLMGTPRLLLTVIIFFSYFRSSNSGLIRSRKSQIRRDSTSDSSRWDEFPSYRDTVELARLSHLVYRFRGQGSCNATDSDGAPLLPSDLHCHFYFHSPKQGTQLLLLSSDVHSYIAVVFAGTDDLRTALTDTDILEKPFGKLDENGESLILPGPARVHAGFDNAVFGDGLYDMILDKVDELHVLQNSYRVFLTGHSLGGADSVLTAVALAHHYPELPVTSISFGCPKTGNRHWRDAVHGSFPNLSIWRFVHGWDLVPRLPEYPFDHVGHTLQMNPGAMNAYYFHRGNVTLGYAGVPLGWSSKIWIFIPGAMWSHSCRKYEAYLWNQSRIDPDTYFVDKFVPISMPDDDMMDDDINDDDPAWNPPDDLFVRDDTDDNKGTAELKDWLVVLGDIALQ